MNTEITITSAPAFYFAVGPMCYAFGNSEAEALRGARKHWPSHGQGLPRQPRDCYFTVYRSAKPITFYPDTMHITSDADITKVREPTADPFMVYKVRRSPKRASAAEPGRGYVDQARD